MSMLSLLFPGELSVMGVSGRQLWLNVTQSNAIWMGGRSCMLKPPNCWALAGGPCWRLRFCFGCTRVNWHANKSRDIPGPMIALFPVLFLSLARRSERSPSTMPNWTCFLCFVCPSFRSGLVSNLCRDSVMIPISYLRPSLNSCAKMRKVQTFTLCIPWQAAIGYGFCAVWQLQR